MIRLPLIGCALVFATAAMPASAQSLLNESNLSPSLILPPPPVDGTPLARAELKQLHEIDATRTDAEVTHAKADDALKSVMIFADVIGPRFDLTHLPETKTLFDTVRREEKIAADRAKEHFKRNRPWIVDASLHPCSTNDEPQSSYPSGHTTMGYAMGSILARLMPDRAPAIMARAADYAHHRMVCEMHYQADVTAGALWGTMIAERLMQQPTFIAQFDRARSEMQAAKLPQ